jgi:ArsR family transcriptional regulator, lead/cadmium/zinc/bismuth-responsive transcriptional repressor
MKEFATVRKIDHPACAPGEHRPRRTALPASAAALEKAVRIFKALGDPPRLRLLAVLAQGELCVSEIAEIDDDGLSTVSQRLRVLRAADLVSRRREGQHILYGLADAHIAELISNALAHAQEGLAPVPTSTIPKVAKNGRPGKQLSPVKHSKRS